MHAPLNLSRFPLMQLSFEPRRPMMLCKVASCCERLNICRACVPGSLDQQIQVVCGIIHLLNWKCHVKNKLCAIIILRIIK